MISVSLLVLSAWLFSRYRKQGRPSALICLIASIALHLGLIFFLPALESSFQNQESESDANASNLPSAPVEFSTFDPDTQTVQSAGLAQAVITPLPVDNFSEPNDFQTDQSEDNLSTAAINDGQSESPTDLKTDNLSSEISELHDATMLSDLSDIDLPDLDAEFDSLLADAFTGLDPIDPETVMDDSVALNKSEPTNDNQEEQLGVQDSAGDPKNENPIVDTTNSIAETAPSTDSEKIESNPSITPVVSSPFEAQTGTVLGSNENDFANRTGEAKTRALQETGGSFETEQSVQRALRFLVKQQRKDGAWDPKTTGAGIERSPLGMSRSSAGTRAETGITGLALLALMGAGHTHQNGEFADSVYRGLAYLIHNQRPSGSMAGQATTYEATYCHGMAALAMSEAAAITKDPSALLSAERAIGYTQRLQHPATGGWRYTEGDPGDLSQLGWQAMVLDAGHRAGIAISPASVAGVQRFLRSVQTGRNLGLASYRQGEAPNRTMTAESLATRLLIGDQITDAAKQEGTRYLMQEPPGVGQDNYYYWYYATIALHQLQDVNWQKWNLNLQSRLLSSQQADGSWPTTSLWGGYGGKIYTTSMATLCLETYYRHTIRENKNRIAQQPNPTLRR
ncbi:terpene cyclase/mutase family protein [bacterium]|nr:terpene cyclase/mutase family protein [bacterium]